MGLSLLRVVHVHAGYSCFARSLVSSVFFPLLLSSLTNPLDALCASAFPVNSLSLTTVSAPPSVPHAHASPPNNNLQSDWFFARSSFQISISLWLGGVGTQSWLFYPLISLGLALAESRLGVPPFSTGNREQVLSGQSQFLTAHALPIIRAYADRLYSLDRRQPAAALLQSWESGHLDCGTGNCHPS